MILALFDRFSNTRGSINKNTQKSIGRPQKYITGKRFKALCSKYMYMLVHIKQFEKKPTEILNI